MTETANALASTRARPTVTQSLQEYARGIAGGLIFSLPLLFTMEMWAAGMRFHPARLLLCVLATFVLLLAYNRYVGLHAQSSFLEVVIDSVEEMGIGFVVAALMMFLFNRISFETPLREALGILVIEAMTIAVGVSVGTAQLGASSDANSDDSDNENLESSESKVSNPQKSNSQDSDSDDSDSDDSQSESDEEHATLQSQLAIAACGATLFAANVAPTEEIVQLGLELSPPRLLGVALLSLLLSAMVLGFSDFRGAQRFAPNRGALSVAGGAALSYAIAIGVSALVLWFFGRFDNGSLFSATAQCVVLALPAALGASAGRLLLQTQ